MLKARKDVPVHSAGLFTWKGQTGTCEASDFNPTVMCSRVYDDACDVGFFARSPRTGRSLLFVFDHQEWDRATGEITAWIFVCPSHGLMIRVIND